MNGTAARCRLRARTKDAGRSRLLQISLKPLAISAEEAAALCSLSPQQFLTEVKAGNLPAPDRRPAFQAQVMEREGA
jgi:hypothetical protein